MNSTESASTLRIIAAALMLWALLLHGCFLFSAGALWRDEANSVNQAQAETWQALWSTLRYDSFPLLYPAILHSLSSGAPGDKTLRVFGVACGLSVLLSVWLAGRILGSRFPIVALALVALNPVLISEGDSIRPYGIGLLCLIWSLCAHAVWLASDSAGWLVIACVASLLAVQASYTAAIFIGAVGLSTAIVAVARHMPRKLWKALLPGLLAATSLLPYANALRLARGWISILHYSVSWREFAGEYLRTHSLAFPIAWLLIVLLGGQGLIRRTGSGRRDAGAFQPLVTVVLLAAVLGAIAQILFMQVMGIWPFPRYLLPVLVLAGLALESATKELKYPIRVASVTAVLLITAWPSWSWLKMRHSNADLVAKVLDERAGASDLVVVSPWFLHPSFQLYYRGAAPWCTVPDLPQQSLTRYDLVEEAMADPQREDRLNRRVEEALNRGGAIWLVSQSPPSRPLEGGFPERPSLSARISGDDYMRYRSYWERAILFRLYDCCNSTESRLPEPGPVWEEEHLVLTRWLPKKTPER